MTYRERREARAERLRGWADKRENKQHALNEAARCDEAHTGIPLGQPILVGHHSERRHRNALDKIDQAMRASIDNASKANSMNSRADEIERQADRAIYDDDPDAIERLTEKLAGLEAQRDAMKARNTAFRKDHRAELKAITSAYQRDQAVPHQGYELQNLGGNITRCRQRLANLTAAKTSSGSAIRNAEGETATARAGLTVTATMTTPAKSWKQPKPVWNVSGNLGFWRPQLEKIGGSWYHGIVSFWEDPTVDVEEMCSTAEVPA